MEGQRLRGFGNDGVETVGDRRAPEEIRERRAEHSVLLMDQRDHLHFLLPRTSPSPSGLAIDRPQRPGWNLASAAIQGDPPRLRRMPILEVIAWPLEHDPEKWVPVFGQDHAQNKKRDDPPFTGEPRRHVPGLVGVVAARHYSDSV